MEERLRLYRAYMRIALDYVPWETVSKKSGLSMLALVKFMRGVGHPTLEEFILIQIYLESFVTVLPQPEEIEKVLKVLRKKARPFHDC